MTPALDPSDPALLVVDWSAIDRLWPTEDYGIGWWNRVSPSFIERGMLGCPPPSDGRPRGHWSRRGVVAEDSRFSGEMEGR